MIHCYVITDSRVTENIKGNPVFLFSCILKGKIIKMKKKLTILIAVIITGLNINIQLTNASQGGPDAYGYIWTDSNDPEPKTTYAWDDISSTGTDIGTRTDDEVKGPFDIGFTFNFYGNDYTAFYIGNNGGILLNNASLPNTNESIPNSDAPNNIIVPFWDDLDTAGSIYYETKEGASDKYLLIQYEKINHKDRDNRYITFQIILFETTNAIKFQYDDVIFNTFFLDYGLSATVGIENDTGNTGLQYSYNTASLENNMAILFEFQNDTPDVPSLVSPANGFITNDNTPTLTAFYSDPDVNIGQINFQIASDAGFTAILNNGSSSQVSSGNNASWTPGSSISDGIRYWRAQAEDIHTAPSTWSSHRTIIIDTIQPITASVTIPVNGANYTQYTIPSFFEGKAADNNGGLGLNANSTVFYLKRGSDNRYWDGSNWQVSFLPIWLSTTHLSTASNTEVTWNDNIVLPLWDNDTYYVKAEAQDKANNRFAGTEISFSCTIILPEIDNLSLNPSSPFNGNQNIQITIDFSKEMDTSVNPIIKFGTTNPYETYTLSTAGVWSQGSGYDIYTITLTTAEIITADTGNYHFNISQAKDENDYTMLVNTIYTFTIDREKPIINNLSLNPPSPFDGSQNIQITIDFSEEMDTSIHPLIRFGNNAPYTNYTLSTVGIWSQGPGYDIYTTTLTTAEIITAGNGNYRFNISQAKDENANTMIENTAYSFIIDTDIPSITNLLLEPASPFSGYQNIKITISFSEEMNTSINPLIRFGQNIPYTDYTLTTSGVWSQGAGYDIYTSTLTISEIITADSGDYHFNISGARDQTNKLMSVNTNYSFRIKLVYPINFADESPTSSQEQNSTTVTCQITVVDLTGNAVDTTTIKYRIENSIEAFFVPGTWYQNNIECINTTPTTAGFKISITGFNEGNNNYIKWKCNNTNGDEGISNPYQIKIITNQPPQLTILQPNEDICSGAHPFIQAAVSDEGLGIDPDSINIILNEYQGSNIITVTGSEHPEIYNSTKGLISYLYQNSSLQNGKKYTVTISVKDLGYSQSKETQKSVNFIIKEKAIIDFIPYPSPFDPLKITLTIRYVLSKHSKITINIYDISGKLIKTIIKNEEREAGEHTKDQWVGTDYANQPLANGIYFCEIIAKNEDGKHRMYKSMALFGK